MNRAYYWNDKLKKSPKTKETSGERIFQGGLMAGKKLLDEVLPCRFTGDGSFSTATLFF